MLKKFSIVSSVAAVVGIVLLAAAPIAAMAATPPPRVLRLGTITASGTGVAAMRGRINLQATSSGSVLLVASQSGTVTVKTDGTKGAATFLGFTVYTRVHSATVIGDNVGAILVGGSVNVHVTGVGAAYFRGVGVYATSSGRGTWSAAGVTTRLGPARP